MNSKQFAEQFAREAGAIIRANFTLGMSKEWKADNSPVTKTDTEINARLIAEVRRFFPEYNVMGEEASDLRGGEYTWVCDPVDGTIPFSHGIPICTFSLGLVKNGESILGVIYDPFQDRLFSAAKGEGAFLNGQPISVSQKPELMSAIGNCEFHSSAPYDTSGLITNLEMQQGAKMFKLQSFIYPAALVATGEVAFSIYAYKFAHDAAAVKIIVEEAGGKVTDLFGNDQRYDQQIKGLIASNGVLHDQLVELAKQFTITKPWSK